jgi:tyrosine-specific transport protein
MATLIGTAIGAGIFGLPYVTSVAGLVPVLALIFILATLMLYSNLMYGEVILRTSKNCGFVGYAHKYLGLPGKRLAAFISFFSLYASNLVYIILGGVFLNSFFSPFLGGNEFVYGTVTFVFAALATYFDLRFFTVIESWMTLLLLLIMFGVIFRCVPHIEVANYFFYTPRDFFMPFGAILFSLGAGIAIPEMAELMKKEPRRLHGAITWGTVAYTLFYLLFVVAVFGVTGKGTTEEAFVGLSRYIGDGVISLGFFFGFLAIITSYLVTNLSIKQILHTDYGLEDKRAWLLASLVPYLFYIFGPRNFIDVITFVGSFAGGLFGILIIVLFYAAKTKGDRRPAYDLRVSEEFSTVMVFIFLVGIVYSLIYGG